MMSPKSIKRHIFYLKNEKVDSFKENEGTFNMNKVFETCRITDVMLLPLYYCWDSIFEKNLTEVEFERYLERPYNMFSISPAVYTMEILLLFNNISNNTKWDRSVWGIIKTYNEIVDYLLLPAMK